MRDLVADLDAELREQRRLDPGAAALAQRRARVAPARAAPPPLELDRAVQRERGIDRAQLDQPRALAGAGHREQHDRARERAPAPAAASSARDLRRRERPRD